jgi:hypothetical protein
MLKYLIFICTMFLTVSTFAQQPANEKQPIVQISSGYSRHIKHDLDGFSLDITGMKAIGTKWFLQYGGGFQQYWGVDKKFDQFLNSFDSPTLQLETLAPLRLQTAGIQLQAGIGRNITRYMSFGMNILGRYQGTSVPESYVVVDVSPNMGSGAQIIDPGYRIDNSPEQQLTAGANCYLLYSPWSKKWWLPGIKLLWQSDLKNNTLLSTHFNWAVKFQ